MRTLLALSLLATLPAFAQTVVIGRVTDDAGRPLPSAGVQLVGTLDGAATDGQGRFTFRTAAGGRHVLRASMLGLEPDERAVTLRGDTVRVELVLRATLIELAEAVVTGTYTTGEAEAVTLSPLEVVTTPGAAADLFRAIQSFPGVASVGEGAGLYVRGGMPSETRTLVDGAFVAHPYAYESPTDGAFGVIPPALAARSTFATGGFGARYGNALSGILDLQTPDLPDERTLDATVGLTGASVEAAAPLLPGAGLRLSAGRSTTDLLFAVNGQRGTFDVTPRQSSGSATLTYAYGSGGQVKLFAFGAADRMAVHVDEPGGAGLFRNETARGLAVLSWRHVWGQTLATATVGANRYATRRRLGLLDLEPSEGGIQARADVERALTDRLALRAGVEAESNASRFDGTVPIENDPLAPGTGVYHLSERIAAGRAGGYVEASAQPLRRLVVTAGLRADRHSPTGQLVADPRLEAVWAASQRLRLRAAWGVYHQFGAPYDFNAESGDPDLRAARAEHWIAGAAYRAGLLTLRAEAYAKPYRHLALRTPDAPLAAVGTGLARGVDVFAQYGAFLRTRANGWVSYSLLQAERDQTRHLGGAVAVARGPAPFDVRHTVSVVGKVRVVGFWFVGGSVRWASGRPHTPAVGVAVADGQVLPVEGPVGSERLPAFGRLDFQVSRYWPLADGLALTLFGALSNATDRANVTGYTYAADYSSRTPDVTSFRRSAYVGATLRLTR